MQRPSLGLRGLVGIDLEPDKASVFLRNSKATTFGLHLASRSSPLGVAENWRLLTETKSWNVPK